MKNWNERHEIFCETYAATANQKKAVEAAGFSVRCFSGTAGRLLKDEQIIERIAQHRQKRSDRTGIDADFVLNQLASFQAAQIGELYEEDGSIKDPQHWPDHWQRMVNGIEVNEIWEGVGEDRKIVGHTKKIKLMDRARVMEMLGKHVDVGAFAEKHIVENRQSFADILAGRKDHAANNALH